MPRDDARTVKAALTDVWAVLRGLGLEKGAKRQPRGAAMVCCPAHGDRTPSCSVRVGPDGTIQVKCFACDFGGDVLGLVAAVRGYDTRADFSAVLAEAAEIAGVALDGPEPRTPRLAPRALPAPAERGYPPGAEDMWARSTSVLLDAEASAMLAGRGIDPAVVARGDLARVIPSDGLPRWALTANGTWHDSGHRLVVPALDPTGRIRTLRATLVSGGAGPKRLAPTGFSCAETVFANASGFVMLANPSAIERARVLVVEGETDLMSAAMRWPDWITLGIFSGAWSKAIADRVPDDAEVVIATDHDAAGEKYADDIGASLAGRCNVWRDDL